MRLRDSGRPAVAGPTGIPGASHVRCSNKVCCGARYMHIAIHSCGERSKAKQRWRQGMVVGPKARSARTQDTSGFLRGPMLVPKACSLAIALQASLNVGEVENIFLASDTWYLYVYRARRLKYRAIFSTPPPPRDVDGEIYCISKRGCRPLLCVLTNTQSRRVP